MPGEYWLSAIFSSNMQIYRGAIGGALATLKNSRVTNQFRWTVRMCTPVPWQTIKLSLDKFRPFNAVTLIPRINTKKRHILIASGHLSKEFKRKTHVMR